MSGAAEARRGVCRLPGRSRAGLRCVLLLAVAMVLIASGSGCTFYALKGNGPEKRSFYSEFLPSADPAQLAEWKETAHEPYLFFGRLSADGRGDFSGYKFHWHPTPYWPVLAGPFRVRKHWEPEGGGPATKRPLVGTEDTWGFFFTLFLTGKGRIYDEKTGLCFVDQKITFVTPLMIFHSGTQPTEGFSEVTESGVDLNEVMYDRVSSWSLGWGLLAAGSKNRRAYLQILWIPIPLWSLE